MHTHADRKQDKETDRQRREAMKKHLFQPNKADTFNKHHAAHFLDRSSTGGIWET
jgi:hypothetical protein